MKLERYGNNPVIKPADFREKDVGAVFNCGAVLLENGNVGLLYRSVPSGYSWDEKAGGYDNYISSIGFAESSNGRDFDICEDPVIAPEYEWDQYGCEDPRVTPFEDNGKITYLITYTALSSPAFSGRGDRVALAETSDFKSFVKHGVIIPGVSDKDAVFFPERINGKIALLHRIPPDIQIVYFDDLRDMKRRDDAFWEKYLSGIHQHSILKRRFDWESEKIGAGPPPLKTKEGWLLIYHAVDSGHVYRAGAALLDLDDPSREIARSPVPVLEPEADYEVTGDVGNVVFPEGAVIRDGNLMVYYGAADTVCSMATVPLDDFLDYLKKA